jgi:hypothetical protein
MVISAPTFLEHCEHEQVFFWNRRLAWELRSISRWLPNASESLLKQQVEGDSIKRDLVRFMIAEPLGRIRQ